MASGSGPVAVVTVTYRSSDDIEPFLRSAAVCDPPPDAVMVVDNRSEDSELTLSRARSLGASILSLATNAGYGAAANAAVAALPDHVRYVVIANPDVRFEVDTLRRLTEALDAAPQVGAVGPKVLNDDGSVYPSARRIPSLRTGVGHALFFRVWPRNPWSVNYREERESSEVGRSVGWLSGSCIMVRREAFEAVGGFDSQYFMYFEDVDLGFRLGRAGWLNRYEPSAVVTHIGATSTTTARADMLRIHHRSAYRFLAGKYRGWHLAPVRWVLHAGLTARAWWLTRGWD